MTAKLLKKIQGFISTKSKRIFIIPTRYGIYFLLTLFILFLISLSFGHSLAFTTTFIFFSLIMVSAHFTNYNIDKVKVISLKGQGVVAGQDSTFEVLVANGTKKWRFDMGVSFVHSGSSELFSLRPYEKKVIRLQAVIDDRGAYDVQKIRLHTTFPFGLFYAWSFKDLKAHFICHPRPTTQEIELPLPTSYSYESGEENSAFLGGSDEFHGHINFLPGMPLKGIDWKAVARGRGKLFKQFVEYGGSRLIIDFNQVTGTLEEKIEKVVGLIDLAEEQGYSYSFTTNGSAPFFGRGRSFRNQRMEELALFKSKKRVMI